tara:strand:+ start:45 stop:254 length:210 start_codon:yes stop_codon:yes gene_type:complete
MKLLRKLTHIRSRKEIAKMLYIVEKALNEIEAMPREKRDDFAHLDREINEAVEKLKVLKDKLKLDTKSK